MLAVHTRPLRAACPAVCGAAACCSIAALTACGPPHALSIARAALAVCEEPRRASALFFRAGAAHAESRRVWALSESRRCKSRGGKFSLPPRRRAPPGHPAHARARTTVVGTGHLRGSQQRGAGLRDRRGAPRLPAPPTRRAEAASPDRPAPSADCSQSHQTPSDGPPQRPHC